MKTVKEIYDFFSQFPNSEKCSASLLELLETLPGFLEKDRDSGVEIMNMSLGREYLNICRRMCEDVLLLEVKGASAIGIDPHYIAVNRVNSSNPQELTNELEYGLYDYRYRGPAYTRTCFMNSVLPIVGLHKGTGNADIGTCYYIGDHKFVTAAHCVKDLACFNVLLLDGTPLELLNVSYSKGADTNNFDLAVITVRSLPGDIKAFQFDEPVVMDEVLTLGYPTIPGLDFVQVAETAKVSNYVSGKQIASVGDVTAEVGSHLTHMDYFVITARVKGGNSGSPVIHDGRVVGTVVMIPSNSDGPGCDIMGYGVCLPAKYINTLLANPEIHTLKAENEFYVECCF